MKKYIIASLLFLTNSSFAQDIQLQPVKFDAYCGDSASIAKLLDTFEEKAFIDLVSNRLVSGQSVDIDSRLFTNPKTKTWTLVEKVTDSVYCIIGSGERLSPHGM